MQIHYLDPQSSSDPLLNHTPACLPAHVLAIGNFDGIHLGHQAMLAALKHQAHQRGLASAVMLFEPQPKEYFAKLPKSLHAPPRLTSLDEKIALMTSLDVEHLVIAQFDERFRRLSAQQFADKLTQLNTKKLVLGDDFRFGHDRTGDKAFLQQTGFEVIALDTIKDDQHALRISSTRVREVLAIGDLVSAKQLLGRDYTITGVVQHGDKIGRTLDFPTANIALNRLKPALHGVFGVSVASVDGESLADLGKYGNQGVQGLTKGSLFGACNVGTRPAIQKNGEQGVEWRCEVFFPEFDGHLYGKNLTVTFLHFLHGEKYYDGLDALKAGIKQDVVDLLAWRDKALK